MEHITVCLCTFKRPALLKKLLERVFSQDTGGLFCLSLSVVDNDPELTGRPVVEAFRADPAREIVYTAVPDKNLALLRNVSVDRSRGDYVAFIDDDEYPSDRWLRLLYETLHACRADGALGPVIPDYLDPPPDWVVKGGFCERARLPTGTPLRWGQTRTGNALLKRELFLEPGNRFDLKYSLGAEDDTLFQKLMGQGREFVWCDEAEVFEQVPACRMTLDYFGRRMRLIGYMTYTYPRDERSRLGNLLVFGRSCLAASLIRVLMPLAKVRGYHRYAKLAVRFEFHKAIIRAHRGTLKIAQRDI